GLRQSGADRRGDGSSGVAVGLELRVRGLRLAYDLPGGGTASVLDIDRFWLAPGAVAGISGPSGSGKTSLLHVLTGLARPQQGAVEWAGLDIAALSEDARGRWRRESVGIISGLSSLPGPDRARQRSPACHVLACAGSRAAQTTRAHVAGPGWARGSRGKTGRDL